MACLWARSGAAGRVLPDGCVGIVRTRAQLIVAGPATRAVRPTPPSGETKVGLRFRVGAAGGALGLPAAELLDRSPALGQVRADGDAWAARVAEAPDVGARLSLLAEMAAGWLADAPAPDPLVRAAVQDLARPRARVAELCGGLAILRRRFERAVGYAPRTLAGVLRLQRFLSLASPGGDLARLAADAGYADQPHLTRDCARLAGLPAAALLAAGVGPAAERRLSSA